MTIYLVYYTYRGDKYSGGQYDSKAEAQARVTDLARKGFPGGWIQPEQHAHTRYCGHK